MAKPKFPCLNNMFIVEVFTMARICRNAGCGIGKTKKNSHSNDDSQTILPGSALINYRISNQTRRTTAKKLIEARIMQAKI